VCPRASQRDVEWTLRRPFLRLGVDSSERFFECFIHYESCSWNTQTYFHIKQEETGGGAEPTGAILNAEEFRRRKGRRDEERDGDWDDLRRIQMMDRVFSSSAITWTLSPSFLTLRII